MTTTRSIKCGVCSVFGGPDVYHDSLDEIRECSRKDNQRRAHRGVVQPALTPELEKPAPALRAGQLVHDGYYTVVFEDGEHRTLRVNTQDDDASFKPGQKLISYLSGPDNTSHYTTFANFSDDDRVYIGVGSRRGVQGVSSARSARGAHRRSHRRARGVRARQRPLRHLLAVAHRPGIDRTRDRSRVREESGVLVMNIHEQRAARHKEVHEEMSAIGWSPTPSPEYERLRAESDALYEARTRVSHIDPDDVTTDELRGTIIHILSDNTLWAET
jgi:hypothetical protein